MILNAYAVLDVFVSLLRLLLGCGILFLGPVAWVRWQPGIGPEARKLLEDRTYLLLLMALLLLVLNVASWPLFYLLLQSYVSEWPGVMCIYGVTQIGEGTIGLSRYLPGLLQALQVIKPALVFVSGAWFVVYLINRRARTAPLVGRLLLGLSLLGALALADSSLETAYLFIPKKEEVLSTGCCTQAFDADGERSRFIPKALLSEESRPWLSAAYLGINLLMIGLTLGLAHSSISRAKLSGLLIGALLAIGISLAFLIEVAAPLMLHLPYHHCPYDLIADVPESMVAMAMFALGTCAVGWAWVAIMVADGPETRAELPSMIQRLMRMALWGYGGSLVMMSLELALA